MIFICNIIIYPLIKKNKFNCVFLSLNIVLVSKNLKSLQTMCLYRTKKSTNILGVSVLGAGPVGTQSVQTGWNPSKPVQINPFEPVETRYNLSKTRSDLLEHVSSRPNEFSILYFYIFIFSILYLPPPPPPPSPPISPYSFFVFLGRGQGTATAPGGSHHHRRPVAPPKGGGQSPPPFSLKQKTKFTNQTTYVL